MCSVNPNSATCSMNAVGMTPAVSAPPQGGPPVDMESHDQFVRQNNPKASPDPRQSKSKDYLSMGIVGGLAMTAVAAAIFHKNIANFFSSADKTTVLPVN